MPVTRKDVVDALAVHEPAELRAVLEASGAGAPDGVSPRDLAERVASRLWWSYCTPLGVAAGRTTLDDMVDHLSRRLDLRELGAGDAWNRLQALSRHLVREGRSVAFEDLDPLRRARLSPSWIPSLAFAGGSGGSFGARFVGRQVLRVGRTPLGRLLPLLPYVGPWYRALHGGSRLAASFGGPVGFAMAVLAANSALGTRYERVVPLLLAIGSLGVARVADAVEV